MREIVHLQAGQCGNQIGSKVKLFLLIVCIELWKKYFDQIIQNNRSIVEMTQPSESFKIILQHPTEVINKISFSST